MKLHAIFGLIGSKKNTITNLKTSDSKSYASKYSSVMPQIYDVAKGRDGKSI